MEEVFERQNRDYASQFFQHLCPTFMKRPQDLQRYEELLSKHKDSANTNFANMLSNEIDLIKSL